MIQGSNFLPSLMKKQGSTIDYGVAPMPSTGGAQSTSLAVQDYLLAFKSTEHKAEVGEFLSFFYSAENYPKFLTNEGMLPVTRSASQQIASTNPDQVPFLDLLPTSKFYPSTDPAWSRVQDETRTSLGQAVSGQVQPAEELARLQSVAEIG
jgi:multiple sugar transport system substrate-binding protein